MQMESLGRPFEWILQRCVTALARARVPASLLTLISFVLCLLAGVFFGAGRFVSAGLAMIPAAACDLLARPLAHRQSRINYFNAFLKSVLHRYADLALFLGLLVYYATVNRFLYALLTGIAMAGAVMVSYSQARAESLIERCRVGFWERPERLGLLILGAVFNRIPIALIVLAIGPNFTVIHRIRHTWKETEGRLHAEKIPAVAAHPEELHSDESRKTPTEGSATANPQPALRDLLSRAAKRGA